MEKKKSIEMYSRLDHLGQVRFLGLLGHELTIAARSWYPENPDELKTVSELRQANEMMHRILGQQIKLMARDNGRYPDDVLFSMIFEMASEEMIEEALAISLRNVARFMGLKK